MKHSHSVRHFGAISFGVLARFCSAFWRNFVRRFGVFCATLSATISRRQVQHQAGGVGIVLALALEETKRIQNHLSLPVAPRAERHTEIESVHFVALRDSTPNIVAINFFIRSSAISKYHQHESWGNGVAPPANETKVLVFIFVILVRQGLRQPIRPAACFA